MFGNFAQTKGEWSFFYRDTSNRALGGTNAPDANPPPSNLDRAHEVGFTPYLVASQDDFSLTTGVKGESFFGGDSYDLSLSVGSNRIDYTLKNSLNPDAPLGDDNMAVRDFDTADLKQEEMVFNADASKNLQEYLTFLYGFEFRQETYTQYAGSYPARVGGGVSGMQGAKLVDAGSTSRSNYALYADLEQALNEDTFLQYAFRFEDYSDFGNSLTGKFAGHHSLSSSLGLRGAISTGFRAPTPGQGRLVTTLTNFANRDTSDDDVEEVRIRHVAADSPEARELGGGPLKEEESFNISLGAVAQLMENMNLTADLYQIHIKDRIYRNEIQGTTQDSENVVEDWSFYTNALDTRHTGLDVVWTAYYPSFSTSFSLAYNYNQMEVTGRRVINDQLVVRDDLKEDIENNYPEHRWILTSQTHLNDQLGLMFRGRYYGAHYDDMGTIAGDENNQNKSKKIDPTLYLDFELSYQPKSDLRLVFGASNFLNTYPTKVTGESIASF